MKIFLIIHIIQKVQESRIILDTVKQHKNRWIGHMLNDDPHKITVT